MIRSRLFEQRRAGVEQVHDHARALDVTQEAVAEPRALARALDQSRDVRDDEAALAGLRDAELRHERRERIGRHARARGREAAQQRRLARVREADETDVGQQLEREPQLARRAGPAALGEVRRLARRRGEVRVAAPAAPAARDDAALAVVLQVGEQPLAVAADVEDDRCRPAP